MVIKNLFFFDTIVIMTNFAESMCNVITQNVKAYIFCTKNI